MNSFGSQINWLIRMSTKCDAREVWDGNGPEFAGKVLDARAYEVGIALSFIRPGKPVENACIESFNGRFREECLNEHWFVSPRHAKCLIESWRIEYNTKRPHSSLGYLTPLQFAQAHEGQWFLTSDSKKFRTIRGGEVNLSQCFRPKSCSQKSKEDENLVSGFPVQKYYRNSISLAIYRKS